MARHHRQEKAPMGSRRDERPEATHTFHIENYNSPKSRYANENAPAVFGAVVFIITGGLPLLIYYLCTGGVDILSICISLVIAVLAIFTIRVASQWERIVVLRLGKFNRVAGPGIYFTIPFFEHVALRADQRIQLTGFSAEETLTSDLVPVNVDAAIFWMVWDPQKACTEVEDYYDAVALAAQTTLRDTIGCKTISDVTVHRARLDQELRSLIEEKTQDWGVTVTSVEIRDIVIPKELQQEMSAEARAIKKRDARMTLVEVESDIASMLHEASEIYASDDIAFKLRQMHLLNEGMERSNGTVVVPTAYTEGFAPDGKQQATKQ